MLVRVWTGRTRREDEGAYLAFLREKGLKDYLATPGFLGVSVLTRAVGDEVEFVLLSRWTGLDAVRAFAGDEPDRAVYYPEDDQFLQGRALHVIHYTLADEVRPA